MSAAKEAPEADLDLCVGEPIAGKRVGRVKDIRQVPKLLRGIDVEANVTEVPGLAVVSWRIMRENAFDERREWNVAKSHQHGVKSDPDSPSGPRVNQLVVFTTFLRLFRRISVGIADLPLLQEPFLSQRIQILGKASIPITTIPDVNSY